jgi:hypothetical protein
MILLKTGQRNSMVVTVSQNATISNPEWLFSFTHIFSKQQVRFIPTDISTHKTRYDEFDFVEGQGVGEIAFPYEGLYNYGIYQQTQGSGNLDPALSLGIIESGQALLIVQSSNTTNDYYVEYVSNNEYNSNYIFAPDELNPPSPTPTVTSTQTPTTTQTPTQTQTQTTTPTNTPTLTYSSTPTNTPTNTPTPSITASQTMTPTQTPTVTQTPTNTNTPTPSITASQTMTPTPSITASQTQTPTQTGTPTPTQTPTNTSSQTQTPTPTQTETPTNTPTVTQTPTNTITPTTTNTPTPTRPFSPSSLSPDIWVDFSDRSSMTIRTSGSNSFLERINNKGTDVALTAYTQTNGSDQPLIKVSTVFTGLTISAATVSNDWLSGVATVSGFSWTIVYVIGRKLGDGTPQMQPSRFTWGGGVLSPYWMDTSSNIAVRSFSGFNLTTTITNPNTLTFTGQTYLQYQSASATTGVGYYEINGSGITATTNLHVKTFPAATSWLLNEQGEVSTKQGEVGEIIMLRRELTPTEKTNLYNHLRIKWGLTY